MASQSTNLFQGRGQPFLSSFHVGGLSRKSSIYPSDKISVSRPTHVYDGRITHSSTKVKSTCTNTYTRVVDDAVTVESVDDRTRQTALNYFSNLKERASEKQQQSRHVLYTGVAETFIGCGVGLSAFILTPPFAILAAAVCGIGLAALGIQQSITGQKGIDIVQKDIDVAEQEKSLWQDPIYQLIEQRQAAGKNGFHYVFNNNLKGKVIHSEEVHALWLRDFSKLLRSHQNAKQVFSQNLLGQEEIGYAWNGQPFTDLKLSDRNMPALQLQLTISRFQECRQAYQSFCSMINNELEVLRSERARIYNSISDLRSQWISPARYLHSSGLEQAEYLYKKAIQPFIREKDLAIDQVKQACHYTVLHPETAEGIAYNNHLNAMQDQAIKSIENAFRNNPAVMEIEQGYVQDRRMCDFLYNQAKLVVDSFFDARVRQLDHAVSLAESSIEFQRSAGLQQFDYNLDQIFSSDNENALKYFRMSPPLVNRNWMLPNLIQEPSWHEVYGQLPRFQSHFRSDISQNAWDLFWGNSGIGRYSCAPRNTWNQLCTDRSAFPFKQHCFNLNTIPKAPEAGIFFQKVIIPPPPQHTACNQRTNTPRQRRASGIKHLK